MDRIVVRVSLSKFLGRERQRHPQVARAGAVRTDCSRWHHANNCVRLGTECEALADDVRVPSKPAPPQLVAKKGHAVVAVSFLLRQEPAAEQWLDPVQRKEVCREKRTFQGFRRALASEREISVSAHRTQALENRALSAPIIEDW